MARAADKSVTPDVTDAPAASAPPVPPPAVAEPPAEAPVTDIPACERWTWDQDVEEVRITLRGLPLGTKPKDVKYKALARFITLSVNGEVVLDKEELAQLIVSEDVDFEIKDAPGPREPRPDLHDAKGEQPPCTCTLGAPAQKGCAADKGAAAGGEIWACRSSQGGPSVNSSTRTGKEEGEAECIDRSKGAFADMLQSWPVMLSQWHGPA